MSGEFIIKLFFQSKVWESEMFFTPCSFLLCFNSIPGYEKTLKWTDPSGD